jgi:5-methylcytosine-specific restriction endonuclease McrA
MPRGVFSRPADFGEKISRGKKGSIPWNKGKKGIYSEDTLNKMSLSKKGKIISQETREKLRKANTGKKHTEEFKKKMSEKNKGSKNVWWRGGVSTQNNIIRHSTEYKLWRKAVFERDNYTCIWCGQRGVKLNADHIKPFSLYPELRFAIDNGRTLCEDCHKKTNTYGNKIKSFNHT